MNDSRSCLMLDDVDLILLHALLFRERARLREAGMLATEKATATILGRVDAAIDRRKEERSA